MVAPPAGILSPMPSPRRAARSARGFTNTIMRFPDDRLMIVVLTNRTPHTGMLGGPGGGRAGKGPVVCLVSRVHQPSSDPFPVVILASLP